MRETTVIPEKKRERADAAANHTRIIAAASAVFAEHGLDAEMREIAERAGVAVGTLYRHFVDRDDLLRAVVTTMSVEVIARLETAAAGDDPCDAVRAVIHTIGAIFEQFQTTFALMHDPRLEKCIAAEPAETHAWLERTITIVVALVTRGIRMGAFRPDLDADAIAPTLIGATFAFESLTAERGYDAVADSVADFFLAGLVVR